MAKAKS